MNLFEDKKASCLRVVWDMARAEAEKERVRGNEMCYRNIQRDSPLLLKAMATALDSGAQPETIIKVIEVFIDWTPWHKGALQHMVESGKRPR